ncbi:MAG: RDD family protein [Gammaproteobacteria bacterium]|nr:RDD family protein [Gammaproteobacteria bacterium]
MNSGLARRLAAIVYDSLLLFGVLFLATIPLVVLAGGQAIRPQNALFTAYLVLVVFGYFTYFWTGGRRTLGMKSWHLHVVTLDGQPPTFRQATLRFAIAILSWAILGLGFISSVFHQQHLCWHDHFSDTRLVVNKP